MLERTLHAQEPMQTSRASVQISSAVDEALAVEQDLRSECERLIERLTVRVSAPPSLQHEVEGLLRLCAGVKRYSL